MFATLPALAFALILASFRRRSSDASWREAFLAAAVVLGAFTVLTTELLSLFRSIGFPAIAASWTIVVAVAAGVLLVSRGRAHSGPQPAGERPTAPVRLWLAGVALYVVTTAVIALVAPPNTWDVMEYHLPKVMHWIQNGSVAFYPTSIPRQNHLAPGAEFAVLHLQLLSGSDRFANLVEWFAMLGSLVAVSLIARQLGAAAAGQCVAAVFAATLPMGIMQASSAQTDYVVALWFLCFVHFLLRLLRAEAFRWPLLLGLSASLGLAVVTKATAYLFAPAFLLWLTLRLARSRRGRAFGAFAAMTAVFLAINLGHYMRNASVYGHPLGPRQEPTPNSGYALDSHAPKALLSSLAKNVATHLNTPWPQVNAAVQRGYLSFHQAIGWDVNDPRTTWAPSRVRFSIRRTALHDESDGNPVHFLLALACGLLVLVLPGLRRDRLLLKYAVAVAAGFLLVAFYLKWHPWMSRLHLAVFVAAAPLVGVVLERCSRKKVQGAVAASLLLLGVPWLLLCRQRPVLGRESIFDTPRDRLYFKTPHQDYEPAFLGGREFLRSQGISQVGLVADNSSWEYMWWVLLRRDDPVVRLEHVNVTDPSARLFAERPFRDFRPQAVVTLDQPPRPEIAVGRTSYRRRWTHGRVGIYLRD